MTAARLTRAELAGMIDHTLLAPTATSAEAAAAAREAAALGAAGVCLSPSRLPLPPDALFPGLAVIAVVGFPSGAHAPAVKAAEGAAGVTAGAGEIDMVMDLGAAFAGRWDLVAAEVEAVRLAIGAGVVLKVILETAAIGPARIPDACSAAAAGGADFVKTSTGFHPAGGTTVADVTAMARAVGGRLGVKASGGIRTTEFALALIEAGATRLGASQTATLLAALD